MTWPDRNICSEELFLLLVLYQYLLPDKNILWKKDRATNGHLTSHRRKTRWSLDCPAHFMGLRSTIYICYDLAVLKCWVCIPSPYETKKSSTKDFWSLFLHVNFCLFRFLRNCLRFGKERSKVIKAEDKFTVIFKEMKQDCLLQEKLFELENCFLCMQNYVLTGK